MVMTLALALTLALNMAVTVGVSVVTVAGMAVSVDEDCGRYVGIVFGQHALAEGCGQGARLEDSFRWSGGHQAGSQQNHFVAVVGFLDVVGR